MWPRRGWLGLALIFLFWPINWFWPGLRTYWAFFPLWLGYALTVDALAFHRRGTSLFARSPRRYVGLFLISAPGWWLFEVFNARIQNWHYVGAEYFSNAAYAFWATLSFSTVMPAVFGTAEWLSGLAHGFPRWKRGPRIPPTRGVLLFFFLTGWIMLALMLRWPRYFFFFIWGSLYLILEPLNVWLGNRHLLEWTARRDWRPIAALWSGVLFTAFFWEMWNYYSYPKWVYTIPFVDFAHVFEMPLLGYLGYLPFALELFALYHFIVGLLGDKTTDYVIRGLVVDVDGG
ncbi:MAG: hypothetical protein GXO55_05420 [Chloroflexi bacterium]|nr:hypothetical protein [Chloroflexota bacterium]